MRAVLGVLTQGGPSEPSSSVWRCELAGEGCPRRVWNGSQRIEPASGALGPPPSLLLIGTRKGGTTSMSTQLMLHTHVIAPDCTYDRRSWPASASATMCVWNKEVRYFSRGLRSLDFCWYRRRYPCVPEGAPHITLDASPDYLVLSLPTIHLMKQSLAPRARLVAMLRNPADRFYSAFNMGWSEMTHRTRVSKHVSPGTSIARNATREPANDYSKRFWKREANMELRFRRRLGGMAEARREEQTAPRMGLGKDGASYDLLAASLDSWIACAPNCPSEPPIVSMFFSYGLYAHHLRKYEVHFGTPITDAKTARSWDRILVIKSEDYYADRVRFVKEVWQFAGLDSFPQVEAALESTAGQDKGHQNAGALWGGHNYLGKLRAIEREKLLKFYAPHNHELYQWLRKDFGWETESQARRT